MLRVDRLVQPIDEARYPQYFSVRKPNSNWNAANKRRVTKLLKEGLMTRPAKRLSTSPERTVRGSCSTT